MGPSPTPLTVGEFLDFVGPGLASAQSELPRWPPDVFALACSALARTGAYLNVVDKKWPPNGQANWRMLVRALGKRWRAAALGSDKLPDELQAWWAIITTNRAKPLIEICDDRDVWEALLQLCAAADEASSGVGIPPLRDSFEVEAIKYLTLPDIATLCRDIHPSRAIVLPKLHTPRPGMTIRSLSHHLALYHPGEVCPKWKWLPWDAPGPNLNLLLLPWPGSVVPTQFQQSKGPQPALPGFGYFKCDITAPVKRVKDVFAAAMKSHDRIDGIVFPEGVLRDQDHESICKETGAFVVAGKGAPFQRPDKTIGWRNELVVAAQWSQGPPVLWQQAKHHRWRLDRSQIDQYGLGGQLDPTQSWWEDIPLQKREVVFWPRNEWLTVCALVCEDLARHEPVAELVRSVGPNLVIAILLDGPQRSDRWSARYATVLADDPGCSVLTLTSLGVVRLTQASGHPPSGVVALWKDARIGKPIEIAMSGDDSGIVLNLTREFVEEWTADGRSDREQNGKNGRGATAYLRLSGMHPVQLQG